MSDRGVLWLIAIVGTLAVIVLVGAVLLPGKHAQTPVSDQIAFNVPVSDKSFDEMAVFGPESEVD